MNSKSKIAVISIVSVLVLAIIGLTIGLVLVAGQATLGGSMHVQYNAGATVDCTITASAVNYSDKDATSEISKIMVLDKDDQPQESYTVDIDASVSGADATTNSASTIGTFDFNSADLMGSGRAVYTFTMKNTSGATGDNYIAFEVQAAKKDGGVQENIIISVGSDRAAALNGNSSSHKVEHIGKNETATIYIVLRVEEAANNAELDAQVTINITESTAPAVSGE